MALTDKQLKELTKAFKRDAKRSKRLYNRAPTFRKRIDDIEVAKDYDGEASPYWERLAEEQDTTGEGMHVLEDPFANPDVLSEHATPFDRRLTDAGKKQLDAIHRAWPKLTPRQREVITLLQAGVWTTWTTQEPGREPVTHTGRLYTLAAVAEKLGVKYQAVVDVLQAAQRRIAREHEKLMTED